MSVQFEIKNNYRWLNTEILLVLVSYEDNRCYQTPNPTHVCFWEGDFQCLFEVYKIEWGRTPHSNPRCRWLKSVLLNDHDRKKDKWVTVPVPDQKAPYVLLLSGGPHYASGYKERNNLSFEISFKIGGT